MKTEDKAGWTAMGFYIAAVVLVIGISISSAYYDDALANPITPTTSLTFEPFLLPDGTPCTLIKGGSHSGMIGATCNYRVPIE